MKRKKASTYRGYGPHKPPSEILREIEAIYEAMKTPLSELLALIDEGKTNANNDSGTSDRDPPKNQ